MRISSLVLILVAGCHGTCNDADPSRHPPREAPRVMEPAARDGTRRVTARVVKYLGISWAEVILLELEGDLSGPAWLYLHAADVASRQYGVETKQPGAVLHLCLAPLSLPDAALDEPYTVHVRTITDGGVAFWTVKACDAAP